MTQLPRHTEADYGQAYADLLPSGVPWPRDLDSVLMRLAQGLAGPFAGLEGRAIDLLENEADPRGTTEMLEDWERNAGLPDPCVAEPLTIEDRRKALYSRLTTIGRQDRAYFLEVAAGLGYSIEIIEYSPFMFGISRMGDTRPSESIFTMDAAAASAAILTTASVGFSAGALTLTTSAAWGTARFNFPTVPGRKYSVKGTYRKSTANPYVNMAQAGGAGAVNVGSTASTSAVAIPSLELEATGTECQLVLQTTTAGVAIFEGLEVREISSDEYAHTIAPPEFRYVWRVKILGTRLSWFRAGSGQFGIDPMLRIGIATDLECLLRRYKPAHTEIVFDYSEVA